MVFLDNLGIGTETGRNVFGAYLLYTLSVSPKAEHQIYTNHSGRIQMSEVECRNPYSGRWEDLVRVTIMTKEVNIFMP